MRFNWQNLNEKKDGTKGSGLRHGRCWWHFDREDNRHDNGIRLEWNSWSTFFGLSVDWGDEDVTLMVALPPIALWLSFDSNRGIFKRLLPRKVLNPITYPDTIVVDEREIGFRIHDWTLRILPYCKRNEWARDDPWWVRGVSFNLNPFEYRQVGHQVRLPDGTWADYIPEYERHETGDGRAIETYPYWYKLRNGELQKREATVYVERRLRRPRTLRWTSLFEKETVAIDVKFSDEVGERSGSWKGGCIGCGYELLHDETAEQCLRRMERERVFA